MLFRCYLVCFLIAINYHRTFYLGFYLIGIHSAATSERTVTKFSYLPFGVCLLVVFWRLQNSFLTFTEYLLLIRGAFNKVPDFFVQAFKIVVDTWKESFLLIFNLKSDYTYLTWSGKRKIISEKKYWKIPPCHTCLKKLLNNMSSLLVCSFKL